MYNKKPINELAQLVKQVITHRLGIETALVEEASMINILSYAIAASQTELYADLENAIRQAFPNYADEEGLRLWGNTLQVDWRTATSASGEVTVTGNEGSVILVDTELVYADGTRYKVTSESTIPAGGNTVSVPVVAVDTGEKTNREVGDTLNFVSTPIGVSPVATVDSPIDGGVDAWTLDEYREAVLFKFSNPPRGGAAYDYEYWTKQVVNAINVWVYSYSTHDTSISPGNVEVLFITEDYPTPPTQAERDTVKDYIDTVRPVGMGTFSVPPLTITAVDFDISISPNNTEIQSAITENLSATMKLLPPGETLTLGKINRAVSDASGLEDFVVNSPSIDKTCTIHEMFKTGTMTWQAIP